MRPISLDGGIYKMGKKNYTNQILNLNSKLVCKADTEANKKVNSRGKAHCPTFII